MTLILIYCMTALGKAFDSIFNKPNSIFIKTTIKDLFFNGIRFDCSVQDFAGVAVCNALKEKKETLIEESDSIFRYGFLATVRQFLRCSINLISLCTNYCFKNEFYKIKPLR